MVIQTDDGLFGKKKQTTTTTPTHGGGGGKVGGSTTGTSSSGGEHGGGGGSFGGGSTVHTGDQWSKVGGDTGRTVEDAQKQAEEERIRNKTNSLIDIATGVIPTPTTPSTPSGGGSGGGSSGGSGGYAPETPSNQSYLDLLAKQKQAEIDALNAALEKNKGMYDTQLADIDNQYKALINQSELNRYKGKSSIREALANRGQLDSGYGRQEALNESLNYGNQVNNIRLSQEKSRQDVQNALNSLQADYQKDLAELEAKYNNLILQAQNM